MSDLQLGVGLEGLDAVLRQLERINGAQQQVGQSSQAANRQAAAGATQATSAMQSFAQSGQNAVQRVQAVAGAVQGLVSQLGSENRTAGLVSSIAGATAQFAAMGSMLGPGGAALGAVVGFGTAIVGLNRQAHDLADAARETTVEVETMVEAMERGARTSRLHLAVADAGEYASEIDRINAALSTNAETIAGMRDEYSRIAPEDEGMYSSLRREGVALRSQLEDVRALASLAANEEVAIMAEDLAAAPSSGNVPSGGGGGASERSAEELAWLDDVAVAQARAAEEEALRTAETEKRLAVEEREYALAMEIAAAAVEADERRKQQAEAARDAQREAMQAAAEHRAELRSVAAEAETSFATGYVNSIDSVAAAWRNANRAAREASTGMLSSGRLLERGLVAVGNNIAESIGGTMVGALGSAVGAWLDGSKSIGEAAEGMAKSIIRGLVQEGIVQAVTETARGIADLASYQYATAGLHFAAAAAWGAVAGVAGAVGAATGAFGGGAGASQGPSQRELASRDRDEGARGGTNIYNIYPGQVLATKDELSRVVLGAANYNARMGRRLDRRLSA